MLNAKRCMLNHPLEGIQHTQHADRQLPPSNYLLILILPREFLVDSLLLENVSAVR